MAANDDPFRVADKLLKEIKAKIIFVDLHAEATSEKLALGWYLDGRVTALVGTHTHIPTADERVMPGGTAYITDVGMTGPYDSVIGVQKEMIIARFLNNMPARFEAATGDVRLCAVVVDCDEATGHARKIDASHAQLSVSSGSQSLEELPQFAPVAGRQIANAGPGQCQIHFSCFWNFIQLLHMLPHDMNISAYDRAAERSRWTKLCVVGESLPNIGSIFFLASPWESPAAWATFSPVTSSAISNGEAKPPHAW